MFAVITWVTIGGLLLYVTYQDWATGEMRLPRAGGGSGRRPVPLRRSDYPMIFATLLVLRAMASVILIMLLTGQFVFG